MLGSVGKKIGSLFSRSSKNTEKDAGQDVAQKALQGQMTLRDFAKQLSMLDKMGSISKIARFVPGMKGMKISPEQLEKGKQEAVVFKRIIAAMSSAEQDNYKILTEMRKKEVAREAQVGIHEVNLLLSRFEQMQQFAKLMKKSR